MLGAAVYGPHRNHAFVDGVEVARHQRLQRGHDVRGQHDGIVGQVRRGAVPAGSVHDDVDGIDVGHREFRLVTRPPGRQVGGHVQAEVVVRTREALEQSVLDHGAGAQAPLFGRLGHQHHGAAPALAHAGELAGHADQVGDVNVVAASVHYRHPAALLINRQGRAGIGHAGKLFHRQAVHVATDHDGGPLAVAQHADHAGAADFRRDVVAGGREFLGHAGGGLKLVQRQFGVTVEVQVQRFHVVHFGFADVGFGVGCGNAQREQGCTADKNPHDRSAPSWGVHS